MSATSEVSGSIMAGAAMVEITPAVGVHLSGDIGRHRPAEVLIDKTYAKAVVVEVGCKSICIVSLDVTIICKEYTDLIRKGASELGLDPEAVMVHATQTHSAPGVGRFMVDKDFAGIPADKEWIGGGEPEYSCFAAGKAVEAIRQALNSVKPVRIGALTGLEGRLAFNRRAVRKDGTVGMPGPGWEKPCGPTWIKYIEGPVDPELGIVCIQDADMHMVAILPHYTCHPVHVFVKGRLVSADWPGELGIQLQQSHGESCVPLVINGCCGNINPWDPFDPDYANDHKRMGRMLAETAHGLIEKMSFDEEPVLDWRVEHISLPIREVDQQEMDWAKAILAEHPTPIWTDDTQTAVEWDWMRAAGIMSVDLIKQREKTLEYEIQVMRIGSIALVGVPGEPFVEGQLAIKMGSNARLTCVAHCCTQYVGYIPTSDAFKRGGHEVNTSYWAKMVPGSLELISDKAIEMINGMFESTTV